MKINTVSPDRVKYLQILGSIAKAPKKLHYAGTLPTERILTVAIVGTRKPSSYGKEVTVRLSRELSQHGIVIVSGLALGVDTFAHRAALEAGGTTIAVLGNPLPDISPRSNQDLADAILDGSGAIISEYDQGSRVYPSNFLERNRIVAGLADALVITEATTRSGTLHTAARALEQGKEVFVVPGNITSPMSAGCNALLKQGARIVTCCEDILEVIAPNALQQQSVLPLGQNPLETKIIELLGSGMRDGEAIMKQCQTSGADFNTALTMLELAGSIQSHGANQWSLR
jgi:DNA processing protein